jgi:hypothetical protein
MRAAMSIFILILIFSSFSLYHVNQNWHIAGEISKNIADHIVSTAIHEQVLMINVPDNFRGAYIYRNGLGAAVSIFHGSKNIKRLGIISLHSIYSINDAVTVNDHRPCRWL